jgi:hypothetical protein
MRNDAPQVKTWAKQHDINTAHCSTLNSWSLALMVLFSQQSYPGGHLLPPLWRVFHEEEPAGPAGAGRPLQVSIWRVGAILSSVLQATGLRRFTAHGKCVPWDSWEHLQVVQSAVRCRELEDEWEL